MKNCEPVTASEDAAPDLLRDPPVTSADSDLLKAIRGGGLVNLRGKKVFVYRLNNTLDMYCR